MILESKRIDWIDTLKGIGIFYVTFAHLNPAMPIEKHIYSFHMFLFFFVSGYLFRRKPEVTVAAMTGRKAKSLLLPFLFWDLAAAAFSLLFDADTSDLLRQMFLIDGEIVWNRPIWFLLTLFLVEVLFFFYDRWMPEQKAVRLIFPAACLVLSYLIRSDVHLKLGIVPIACFYYWLGYVARQTNLMQKLQPRRYLWLALFMVMNLIASQFNVRVSVIGCIYGSFKLFLIAGVSGVLLYAILANMIDRTQFAALLRYIGQRSMIIMCSQYFVFRIGTSIAMRLAGYDLWHVRSTLKAFAVSVATIALIVLLSECAKKVIPKKAALIIGIK